MAMHPDGYWFWISTAQEVPKPAEPRTWIFQLQMTWEKHEDEDVLFLTTLESEAETFAEPFWSAFLWILEDTKVYENNVSYWIPRPWNDRDGRVVLVDDAALPMTFHRGQGLNHGIADTRSLVKNIVDVLNGNMALQEALTAYQSEMIPRAGDAK